ncbi:MAG TPA: LPS assembly protein LptD, partial [Nitrospiria bacterium]|nr:LPS assembly protein LptD [Nitrospiria bacterium]
EVEDEAAGLVTAYRLDVFPHVSVPFKLAGIEFVPRAGYRETWYSRRVDSEDSTSRGVEVFQVRARTRLFREFHPALNARLRHAVQPGVDYDYVPAADQARLPHFDAVDDLPRKNRVTYFLTNRLIFSRSPGGPDQAVKPVRRELFFWKVSQSYDLHARRIREDPGPSRPYSNVRSETILRPTAKLTVDLDVFYSLSRDETVSFDSDMTYAIFSFWQISAGQRYTRAGSPFPRGNIINVIDPDEEAFWFSQTAPLIRFFSGSTRLTFPFGLTLTTTAYYEAQTREFVDILYGLDYNGRCWGFSATYQDLPDENQFTFMVTLRPPNLSGKAEKFSGE